MDDVVVTVNVVMPEYLRSWLIHEMGGVEPVRMPKGSVYTAYLRVFLRHRYESEKPVLRGDDTVEIVVPRFPGRNQAYDCFLSVRASRGLVDLVRDGFDLALFTDFVKVAKWGKRRNEFLMTWMEEHGIEVSDRNFEAVNMRLKLLRSKESDRIRKRQAYCRKVKVDGDC